MFVYIRVVENSTVQFNKTALELVPKHEKKSVQSFHKFVIERMNSRRSVIYGCYNGFYRWNILVGVPTPEVLGQVLNRPFP
ncbi:hypothetical protein D1609_15855 [Leptospira borgpetersenii serovar Hardjo-bovis]|nr:hypothetical protein B9T54_15725 [Leptospira borgpetersenii serovar Hardjo-bovis]AYR09670.1 hypothetical protein D1609_15855 [Leptospira borgpetersenii serovar Hardjo-bovis]